jgi:outer membrane protein insertion porin family
VTRIALEGNERITRSAMLAVMRTEVGAPLRSAVLDEDVKRLYGLGFYEVEAFAEAGADGVAVRVVVKENSRIAKVTYRGMNKVDREDVESAVTLRAGQFASDMVLELVTRDIEDLYHGKGFLFVDVKALKLGTPAGIEVTIRVIEGPRVQVASVKVVGNEHLTSAALRRIMQTSVSSWIRRRYLDRRVLDQDIIAIRNWYRGEGFRDVSVELGDIWFNQAHDRASITLLVREGPRYRVRDVRFEGNELFTDAELSAITTIRPGSYLEDRVVALDRRQVLRLYGQRAYIDAAVEPRPFWDDEEEGVCDLVFRIREGEKVFLGKLRIEGNRLTHDKVIRRGISLAPGDPIDFEEVRRSYNRLAQSGYYVPESVSIEEADTPGNRDAATRDYVVRVQEGQTGWIRFALGVGSNSGVIGDITLIKRNFDIADLPESFSDVLAGEAFTGAGQTLTLQLSPGTELSRYRIAFREPFLFDTKNSFDAEIFRRIRLRPTYDETRTGGRITLGRYLSRFTPDLSIDLQYRAEQVELSDLDRDAPQDAFDYKGDTNVSGLGPRLVYRQLDAPVEPTKGFRAELGYEYVGHWLGGDVDMHSVTGEARSFFPVWEDPLGRRHVLSVWTRLGWSEATRDTDDVPIFERFFAGGRESIRGFEFRGVGPHDQGEPIGGSVLALLGSEYQFPIVEEVLRGVVFLDSGTVSESVHTEDIGRFRLAAGFGFRLRIPFLGQVPLALDFGFPIYKQDEDETQVVSFSLGAPFFGF